MTTPRVIPDSVRHVQLQAASPEQSVFVSANAGSGKTHVLAQRVINLLLRGCDPAKILCITFTKAAAANMANRVFETLAAWTALDDAALDQKILESIGTKPDAAGRARARRLFASALETPGGLKVQTIHAFCTRLLHQFPFEANVAARFTVLDEAQTSELLEELTLAVLLEAANAPDSRLGKALSVAIVAAADTTFKDVIRDAIKARDTIERWLARTGGVDAAIDELSARLGVDALQTQESVEHAYLAESPIPEAHWPDLIEALRTGSKSDHDRADAVEAARLASGKDRIAAYLQIFCTKKKERRERLLTKKTATDFPEWAQKLSAEQDRICDLIAKEHAIDVRERTRALLTIAADVIARYRHAKDQRALLDYDDLIDKTLPLLEDAGASAWVHYKLDLGIDHMLIDEAQDTSPKQWEIIKRLASEFPQGGARPGLKRTIFAVGDEKQSIFSFQGAQPAAFADSRRHFEKNFREAQLQFSEVKFGMSFRSGEVVLKAVDAVFARETARAGLSDDPAPPVHTALAGAAPGEVDIWPLVVPDGKTIKEGWDAPFDRTSEVSPRVRLARHIADHVALWCSRGVKPKDVLILVRQRGPLFEAIIRALKNVGVPVAGADRLVLTEHIAVMDLMALADCLLLPEDDLALASVLRSPLFGLSDEQLFALAWHRKGSLRTSIAAKAADDPAFAEIDRTLTYLAHAARTLPPFGFYAHVLGALGGRRKFLARLGFEANDALDEFLNLALDYEARETPSLQGFINYMRKAESEVRRDMEMARDEVRVMTVHGAKGLEANTVILADTTTKAEGSHPPRLIDIGGADAPALVWARGKTFDTEVMAKARERALAQSRDEYRRLLYVAMTRAAERLIVCGARGVNDVPKDCWYRLIEDGLKDSCEEVAPEIGTDAIFKLRKAGAPPKQAADASGGASDHTPPPSWLTRKAPQDPTLDRTITPSTTFADERQSRGLGDALALERGRAVHRLMQSLPDVAAPHRAAAARDYLARAHDRLDAAERDRLLAQVTGVLGDTRFAPLFASGSRPEVPVIGRLALGGTTVRVSGQIDRLAVTAGEVLIGDFKTNRNPPRRIEDVPQPYVRQLALYRAVLAGLYPDRVIRAALIWTEGPDIMEISANALDAALAAGHLGVTAP